MTKKEINEKQKRITDIWDELEQMKIAPVASELIQELIDLEIELESECNQ